MENRLLFGAEERTPGGIGGKTRENADSPDHSGIITVSLWVG
jgi:hypothetical protein